MGSGDSGMGKGDENAGGSNLGNAPSRVTLSTFASSSMDAAGSDAMAGLGCAKGSGTKGGVGCADCNTPADLQPGQLTKLRPSTCTAGPVKSTEGAAGRIDATGHGAVTRTLIGRAESGVGQRGVAAAATVIDAPPPPEGRPSDLLGLWFIPEVGE